MACEWAIPRGLIRHGVNIGIWQRALEATPGVMCVHPVVDAAGVSRKSKVAEEVVARGGGHFSAVELYVFLGIRKKERLTSGLTTNRNFLHTYIREPPARVGGQRARAIFNETCSVFQSMAQGHVVADPPPPAVAPVLLTVLHDFNGAEWGHEYLSLQKGDMLTVCAPEEPIDAQG